MRKVLFICFAFLFIIFSKSNVLALDLTTSIGCRAVYIGSYDDVHVLNTKENVTGDVLSIDGRPVGSCYAEFVLSKKSAGIQSFRYESNYNPLADLDEAKRVSPFDERGKKNGNSNLEDKKASIQRLASDIAPIATLPELVISFREDSFHSMIHIESSQSVQYIPYDNSTSTLTLNPKTDYWVDIVLEEINVSWNFSYYNTPVRILYFDIIFQKPILLENTDAGDSYEYDLYSPKFFIQGTQLDISSIPLSTSISAGISYGTSLGTSYMIMKNEDLDSTLDKRTKVNMHRMNLELDYQVRENFSINYYGEFMWIKLDNEKYNNNTISLDAINNISFAIKF